MLLVVFGPPGAGKTYVGKILRDGFGFVFYDGDKNLTYQMREAIKEKQMFTDAMRDNFFGKLIKGVAPLNKKFKHLVIAQTFIKEKYRKQFLKVFPHSQFILVKTKTPLRENRLAKRKAINDLGYLREMVSLFEEPKIKHVVLQNNTDGKNELKERIKNTLGNFIL